MARFLGKRPARHGAVKLRFGDYASPSALPTPPAAFGHYGIGRGLSFGMLGNDSCGDCVFAGAAHETMIWTHRAGPGAPASFSDAAVLSDYAANTGYNPANPDSDQGTDLQQAASYRRKVGVLDAAGNRHRIDSYLALRPGDCRQVAGAAYLFGAVGVGLMLPDNAEDQFDRGVPWKVDIGARSVGGHYVALVGRNGAGNFLVVTWGKLHAMEPAFLERHCDEAMAYVTSENMLDGVTPEGFNLEQLRADLAEVAKPSA